MAELRKTISLRKQRLLLKGDVDLMTQARIKNGMFHSGLPLAVNAQQGPTSPVARFLRKVIVASGLSKTQAKKSSRPCSQLTAWSRERHDAKGISMNAVRSEYAMRQMTLHAYLHSVTSSQELRATVEDKIRSIPNRLNKHNRNSTNLAATSALLMPPRNTTKMSKT